jgi:hypothetical protein
MSKHIITNFFGIITPVACVFDPQFVYAHAFGYRYDLPLPMEFYMTGATLAVLISFVVMGVFLKDSHEPSRASQFNLLQVPGLQWLQHHVCLSAIRLGSVTIFAFILIVGFFGNPDPLKNIAPTFIWVIWWVGMAFVSALVGDLWSLINPWKILFFYFEKKIKITSYFAYPQKLSYWPAVGLFVIFAWMELISEGAEAPQNLSIFILTYSFVTWVGMLLFGGRSWLTHGEIFTVTFGLLARFAPTIGGKGSWNIRLPGAGLVNKHSLDLSLTFFILLLLATVTFDGILETPLWSKTLEAISQSQSLRAILIMLQNAGLNLIQLIKLIFLLILPCIFFIIFLAFCHAIAMFGGGGKIPTRDISGYFILSLIPIAIAYHFAHYLSYLLIAGQHIVPLVSDPFGAGWDLFNTKSYKIDIGIINAKFIWYFSITVIVIGHAMAVYVAHLTAVHIFVDRELALRSQLPMLALMIVYTMTSLWILSQPIVN